MQFRTEADIYGKTNSRNIVPGHCRKLLIPSAQVTYTEGSFGNIFSQEITTRYYTIEYHHFEIRQQVCLCQATEKPALTLNFVLKGHINCTVFSEEFILSEENYYLFNMLTTEYKMYYEPGVYDLFNINTNPKYLEACSHKYESLKKLLELIENRQTGALKFSEQIIYSIRNIIQQILNCPDDELESAMLQNVLADQLILKFLRDIQSSISSGFHERKISSRKLEEIKLYILNNLGDHLTIETLAARFTVSEGSLKRHFKQQFKMALHGFIKEQRMLLAAKLLAGNTPIHEIANFTGFADSQAFSHAFSAHYKMSPTKYKKEIGQNYEKN